MNSYFEERYEAPTAASLDERVDSFTGIFYADRFINPPQSDELDWICDWLEEEPGRCFVYIMRDGDCTNFLKNRWIDEVKHEQQRQQDPDKQEKLDRALQSLMSIEPASQPYADEVIDLDAIGISLHPIALNTPLHITSWNDRLHLPERAPEPFHMQHGFTHLHADWDTLASVSGEAFICQRRFGDSHFIIVANATAFLDASMVDPRGRECFTGLMDYGDQLVPNQKWIWLRNAEIGFPNRQASEKDAGFMKLFTTYPLAYFSYHLLGLCVLVILWQSFHLGRRQSLSNSNQSAFNRHLEAIGVMLANRHAYQSCVKALQSYLKLGKQPTQDEEEARALFNQEKQ